MPSGVHPERGITDTHTELQQARTKILLVDHTKLGAISKCLVCSLTEIDMIITDDGASDNLVRPFEEVGIKVRRV